MNGYRDIFNTGVDVRVLISNNHEALYVGNYFPTLLLILALDILNREDFITGDGIFLVSSVFFVHHYHSLEKSAWSKSYVPVWCHSLHEIFY